MKQYYDNYILIKPNTTCCVSHVSSNLNISILLMWYVCLRGISVSKWDSPALDDGGKKKK